MKIEQSILNILEECTVKGNILYLPGIQLDRKTYEAVNKCLESIGGKWNRKAKGHTFEDDLVERLDNLLQTGETVDTRKEFQYFPTPRAIAKKLVELADIDQGDVILEPSAGQGAIIDAIPPQNKVIAVELNQDNVKALLKKGYKNVDILLTDFLAISDINVNKVIMNPPFSKQQDITHIYHAFKMLEEGGILVSVVSESLFFRENEKSVGFRRFLLQHNAEIIELPAGAFKESGTMVRTRVIKVKK